MTSATYAASSQVPQGTWSSVGAARNGGYIWCQTAFDGKIYEGTDFGVWYWDGTNWLQLGGAENSLASAQIFSITEGIGQIYAGTKDGVWCWDGTDWSRVGNDLSPTWVYALITINNTVYAGTGNSEGVWSWNGTNWSKVGGENNLLFSKNVVCLKTVNNILYAGTTLYGVWSWNGTNWSMVGGSANSLASSDIYCLSSVNGILYAGTVYPGTESASGVWAWNGTKWSMVGGFTNPLANTKISSLTTINDSLYAGTDKGLWCWNGTNWSQVGGVSNPLGTTTIGLLSTVNGIIYSCTSDCTIWCWNGADWSELEKVGSLFGTLKAIKSLTSVNEVVYAGTSARGVLVWDGTNWTQVGGASNPLVSAEIDSLTTVQNAVYAGTGNQGVWVWQGENWSQVGGSSNPLATSQIYSLTIVNDVVYAGTSTQGLWSWNGVSWLPVGGSSNPLNSEAINCLLSVDGKVYAGTDYYGVCVWNGTKWSQLAGSSNNLMYVYSLTTVDNTVCAGIWAGGVWSWNGSDWLQVSGSSNPLADITVGSLINVNGILYAGTGDIYDGQSSGLWALEGENWMQVAGTTDHISFPMISSLTIASDAVYAGTYYAGNSSSFWGNGVWKWSLSTPVLLAKTLAITAPNTATANNAFNITVTAKDISGNTVTGYQGTVHFASTDTLAELPADYSFTSSDNGSHTFSVTLKSVGTQSFTVTDTDSSGNAPSEVTQTVQVEAEALTAQSVVQIGANPNDGDSVGIFIGLDNILHVTGSTLENPQISKYQIEVDYNPDLVTILDVIDEAHLGNFKIESTASKVTLSDYADQGTHNYNKLCFIPIALKGSVLDFASISVKYVNIKDADLQEINVTPVNLEFQRGKVLKEELEAEPKIEDAVAGLQFLAGLRNAGLSLGEVNLINMASILEPGLSTKVIKPNVKNVIALMQYLAELRDISFKPVNKLLVN